MDENVFKNEFGGSCQAYLNRHRNKATPTTQKQTHSFLKDEWKYPENERTFFRGSGLNYISWSHSDNTGQISHNR